MMNLKLDILSCPNCDNREFTRKELFCLSKDMYESEKKTEVVETTYVYSCSQCDMKLEQY